MKNEENPTSDRIVGIFPIPVYRTHMKSDLDSSEIKDIEDIIEEGMRPNILPLSTSPSLNTYIFNTKLKKIKEFCEKHIKIYVKEIINPKEELDFYITQSWLNIIKPGGILNIHAHSNSIISGVFYISTVEDDRLHFYDSNTKIKRMIAIDVKEATPINTDTMGLPVNERDLLLFPAWQEHGVEVNQRATSDRISLAFNVYARGTFGNRGRTDELIL